ncbi:MAG: DNA polymerase II large subunit, partial [Halobacteriota archaeon]
DPSTEVEIPVARDLADRVENLVEVDGVAERIRDLEEELEREDVALELAREFAEGAFDLDGSTGRVEAAVRTAVALLTEGVVAAPIEGIDAVEVTDGGYVRVEYAGPIRSAGGTAQALSVLIADYVRREIDVAAFEATDEEVERYVEEINLYDDEVGLQYSPPDDEIRSIVENCPVCLDGEPTSEREVSGYRDLERVDTNRARGGMCLVAAEGIAQKAPKILKHVEALEMEGWSWLESRVGSGSDDGDSERDGREIQPESKYLYDLTAGRPIFSHPSRPGGFRLRYGRARNTGFAASGVSPATMAVVDDFLATGTQLKTERPGKAQGVAPVDGIEGPTVRLRNGEVRRLDDVEEARRVRNAVESILDVGEIAVPYGEFLENNHPLMPASYTVEWWLEDLAASDADVDELGRAFDLGSLSAKQAFHLSEKYDVPLHPGYTYLWHDVSMEEYEALARAFDAAGGGDGVKYAGPDAADVAKALERLLVPHRQRRDVDEVDAVEVEGDHALALERCLSTEVDAEDAVEAASIASGVDVRRRAPTRIGARMGRPEKSKEREMSPAVHCLFPLGEAGGSQRDIDEATSYADSMQDRVGVLEVSVGVRRCERCETEGFRAVCDCGERTSPVRRCRDCDVEAEGDVCPRCDGPVDSVGRVEVDLKSEYSRALDAVGERRNYDILKCVKGLTSEHKTPEPLEKGVLRAKHDVTTFKDGTVRYDMTDLPLTAFRPRELDVSVERLRELGYERDVEGEVLETDDQVVELRVQDVVLSRDCAEHMKKVADFVDDLLESYYGVEPYYELDGPDDLVGELVMGLAPHTSAGVLGRVVGFTSASVGYAHPFFHAAKRRNCDGDEDCVMLLLDGLLNFSRSYLPDRRGGRMDAPLVMTSRIDPLEIDDEAHNVDKSTSYSRSFYEATLEHEDPKDVDVHVAEDDLGSTEAVSGFRHSIETSDVASGPDNSAYKTLGSMVEKTENQLEVARKTRAVDEADVAERVIESHFLPDLIGNLRAFSQQEFRCTSCNDKYRRPPLSGGCECGGDLTLTVHEGSVKKYLEVSLRVGEEYGVSGYTMQRLDQLSRQISSLFEDDLSRQSGIAEFM